MNLSTQVFSKQASKQANDCVDPTELHASEKANRVKRIEVVAANGEQTAFRILHLKHASLNGIARFGRIIFR